MIPWAIAALALLGAGAVVAVSARRVRRVNRRFQILDEIARVAESGATLEETLDAIADVLVPEWGDFCTIDVIDGGKVRRATARVNGPNAAVNEAKLAARTPALQTEMATAAVREHVKPRFFEYVSDEDLREVAESAEDFQFLLSLRIRSGVAVELRARGRATGMLTVGVGTSGRRFRPNDVHFAGVVAGRVALALDNAGLFSVLERSERERT